jgi:hypothetical protein
MDRHDISEAFRKAIFDKLEDISRDRQNNYGPAEKSFQRIAILWEAYWECKGLGITITPSDVANMMALFKMSRQMGKHDFENILDGANYLCFGGGFCEADMAEATKHRAELEEQRLEAFSE